jgi:hypothetical protein
MKSARARLLRDSPLLSSRPVSRRNSGSSIQSTPVPDPADPVWSRPEYAICPRMLQESVFR